MKDAQNILDDTFDLPEAVEDTAADPVLPEAPPEGPESAPEAAPPETPAPITPEPETPAAQQPHMVPVDVVAELRERVRRAEEKAEAAAAGRKPLTEPEPEEIPDPVDDPQGFRAWQEGQLEAIRWNSVSNVSQHMANQAYGKEAVFEAAKAYVTEAYRRGRREGEVMLQRLRQLEHPYEFCVQWHERQQMLSTLNPDSYRAYLAWQQGQTAQPGSPSAAPPAPAAPAAPATSTTPPAAPRPPVIADAPSAGGVSAAVDVAPLDAVFPD
jgi:hypothetical protein